MKRLLLAAAFFFAPAGVAHAAPPVRMVVRDVVPSSPRALASATPRFNLVGLHWQGAALPWFRTRSVAGRWSAWQPAATTTRGARGAWRAGQSRVDRRPPTRFRCGYAGRVTRVREYLLWSPPIAAPERRLQLAGSPVIITRAGLAGGRVDSCASNPRIAPTLKLAVVHHTATPNAYSCARSASIVRGIEVYHVKGNGWDDIGYNFLVDACGQVFEGRYGGIERNVIGAHSGGFNTGTVGVSMIGNYEPSGTVEGGAGRAREAARVAARRRPRRSALDRRRSCRGATASSPPAGRSTCARSRAHRDTYLTACPGSAAYRLLPSIASRVAQTGLAEALRADRLGRRSADRCASAARLSSRTAVDGHGRRRDWCDRCDSGAGIGANVDWTWDATFAVPGAAYTWVISAGGDRAPAVGVLGGKLADADPDGCSRHAAGARRQRRSHRDGELHAEQRGVRSRRELRRSLRTSPATLFVQTKSAGVAVLRLHADRARRRQLHDSSHAPRHARPAGAGDACRWPISHTVLS